jgi:hypothetical protein
VLPLLRVSAGPILHSSYLACFHLEANSVSKPVYQLAKDGLVLKPTSCLFYFSSVTQKDRKKARILIPG